MTNQDYQQQFVQYLEQAVNNHSGDNNIKMLLVALIDSLPALNADALLESVYGTLGTIVEMYLPNDGLQAQPGEPGMCATVYQYSGPYTGYQNAFYTNVTLSSAAAKVVQLVMGVSGSLNANWWAKYAVAVLTDAISSSKISVSIDTDKLSNDLSSYNTAFLPALTPAYVGIFQLGYSPTCNALNSITSAGQSSAVASLLEAAILDGYFTTNINTAMSGGGDGAQAAVWFEFNLWVSLQALGVADVNGFIQQAINSGLDVPIQVGPNYWWNGGYTTWYSALSGTDVLPVAAATINTGFPQLSEVICSKGGHTSPQIGNVANGYCISLCEWGSLNWYLPSSGSCFGKQTGVLMADGAVKTIDKIEAGDMVQSSEGPRKVVLVESPKRGNRALYQLNDEQVYATAAHPFRALESAGPFRYAVKPWEVLDNLPTMIEKGVGTLQTGAVLQGRGAAIPVQKLQPFAAGGAHTEQVYDLILESWEKEQVTYYVGGPERFYAVDAETVDPTYHLPTTAGILAAMSISLPVCRELLSDPVTQLPRAIGKLDWAHLRSGAYRHAVQQTGERPQRIRIPGPDFYKHNGQWCPCASALEFYLVKHFGYALRRESVTGWRATAIPPVNGNHLAVTLHDIVLAGDHALPAKTPVTVTLQYIGWGIPRITPVNVDLSASSSPAWLKMIDQVIDLGPVTGGALSGRLTGKIHSGGKCLGTFTAPCIDLTAQGGVSRYFIFNDKGIVIGRIALEQARVLPGSLSMASTAKSAWTDQKAMDMAMRCGEGIGRGLVNILREVQ
jgi:hypothetical protein